MKAFRIFRLCVLAALLWPATAFGQAIPLKLGSYAQLPLAFKQVKVCDFGSGAPYAGLDPLDGVTLADGDRVLCNNPEDGPDQGIWIAHATDWTRASDWNGPEDVIPGITVCVTAGTTFKNTQWQLQNKQFVIGTTDTTWQQVEGFPKSTIVVLKSGGSATPYYSAPGDATAAGAQLRRAVNFYGSGPGCILVGPGTYDLGSTPLTLPGACATVGTAGWQQTEIQTQAASGASCAIELQNGTLVRGLYINANLGTTTYQFPIGVSGTGCTAYTEDCKVSGDSDNVVVQGSGTNTLYVTRCVLSSHYDCVANLSNSTVIVSECDISANANGTLVSGESVGTNHSVNGVNNGSGGTLTSYRNRFTITGKSGGTTNFARGIANFGTLESRGDTFQVTGAVANYDLDRTSGTLSYLFARGSNANGSLNTNGTVTPLDTLRNTVPTTTGLNLLSAADAATARSVIGAGTGSGDVSSSRSISTTSPLAGGGDLSANRTLSIPAANGSTNGYLSSTDWTTFNNKGAGTVTSVAATVPSILSVSGSPVTTSGTLAMTLANQSANKIFAGPASGAAAPPGFRDPVTLDTPQLMVGGSMVRLTGAKVINGFVSKDTATGSGQYDIYTCPSGKKAWVSRFALYNSHNTTARTWHFDVKIGSTYYSLSSDTSLGSLAAVQVVNAVNYVLEATDKVSINLSGDSVNTWASIIEFDDTVPLKTAKLTSLSNGFNTLYTCPASTSFYVLDLNSAVATLGNAIGYINNGASSTLYVSVCPSGTMTPTASHRMTTGVSNAGASGVNLRTNHPCVAALSAGDFISVNSTSSTATQFCYVTGVEIPASSQ